MADSTVSSGVNALALTFMTDVLRPLHHFFTKSAINERRATLYSKLIALIFGFLTIGLAFLSEKMGPLILQIALSIFGMVGGPLLSLFVMAMFIPCVNSWVSRLFSASCRCILSYFYDHYHLLNNTMLATSAFFIIGRWYGSHLQPHFYFLACH